MALVAQTTLLAPVAKAITTTDPFLLVEVEAEEAKLVRPASQVAMAAQVSTHWEAKVEPVR
jgi:hypothetical protein